MAELKTQKTNDCCGIERVGTATSGTGAPHDNIKFIQVVYRMYTGCVLDADRMHAGCAQDAYRMYTGCIQGAYRMHTGCVQGEYRMCTGYSLGMQ